MKKINSLALGILALFCASLHSAEENQITAIKSVIETCAMPAIQNAAIASTWYQSLLHKTSRNPFYTGCALAAGLLLATPLYWEDKPISHAKNHACIGGTGISLPIGWTNCESSIRRLIRIQSTKIKNRLSQRVTEEDESGQAHSWYAETPLSVLYQTFVEKPVTKVINTVQWPINKFFKKFDQRYQKQEKGQK